MDDGLMNFVRTSAAAISFPIQPPDLNKVEVEFGMKTYLQNRLKYLLAYPASTQNTGFISDPKSNSNLSQSFSIPFTLNLKNVNSDRNRNIHHELINTGLIANSKLVPTTTITEEKSPYIEPSASNLRIPPSLLKGTTVTLSNILNSSDPDVNTEPGISCISNISTIVSTKNGTNEWIHHSQVGNNSAKNGGKCKTKTTSSNCYLPVETTIAECEKKDPGNIKEAFCWTCGVNCGNSELLQEHKDGKGFICRVCTLGFELHTDIEAHFLKHKMYRCKVCNTRFPTRKDYCQHRTLSKTCNLRLECDICNKLFFSRKSLNTHKKNLHNNEIKSFRCIVCSKPIRGLQYFNSHMKSSHTVYELIECKLCQKLLLGPERLKTHIKGVHIDSDVTFDCSTCGKVFKTKNIRDSHEKAKHDNSVNLCELCGKSFTGKIATKIHMENAHPRKGQFACSHCNQQFELGTDLKVHYKKTHKKRKVSGPAFCEICGKVYKTPEVLKKHKLIHSDERTFKCEVCGATFKQLVTLRTHSRVHSSIDKYFCNGCDKSFRWKQTFDKHVKNCESL